MSRIKTCFTAVLLAVCLVCSFLTKAGGLPLKMNSGQELDAYGILLFDQGEQKSDIVSFKLPSVDGFTTLFSMGTALYPTAGAYADGTYYFVTAPLASSSTAPDKLYSYDFAEGGSPVEVGTVTGVDNKANAMTYDYSTGTMYFVSSNLGGSGEPGFGALYTIDLENASVTKVADLERYFFALACTYDGQLYGVNQQD